MKAIFSFLHRNFTFSIMKDFGFKEKASANILGNRTFRICKLSSSTIFNITAFFELAPVKTNKPLLNIPS
jgi:hypothetical protein